MGVWVSSIDVLSKLAIKYPQAIYVSYKLCLQAEWQYLCRCMSDIAKLFDPLEKAVWDKLLPALLGIKVEDIDHCFRKHLLYAVK